MKGEVVLLVLVLACGAHGLQGKWDWKLEGNVRNDSCVTCQNGEKCCDGEKCCGNGAFCCKNSATCCNDTCCDDESESCCNDPIHGGVCCIKETTYCCAPNPPQFPSRCCPRWMVCCLGGRYGCCDPGELVQQATIKAPQVNDALALFVLPEFVGGVPMYGMSINQGGYKSQKEVPSFNTYGEETRVFMFNAVAKVFYLLQANFTAPPHEGDPQREITLFEVDPLAGTSKETKVKGAYNQVTGYAFDDDKQEITFATYAWKDNKKIGYNFYRMNPTTAVAKQVSMYANTGGEDQYAGWFKKMSSTGNIVYRLGYKDVYNQNIAGIGYTDISNPIATTNWYSNITQPKGFSWYQSIQPYRNGFLSLAVDENSLFQELNLIEWTLSEPVGKVLTSLGNAHNTPYFGPVVGTLNYPPTHYLALVVDDGPTKDFDRWAMVTVDLASNTPSLVGIFPWMIAETDSISGFGVPR